MSFIPDLIVAIITSAIFGLVAVGALLVMGIKYGDSLDERDDRVQQCMPGPSDEEYFSNYFSQVEASKRMKET